jgi:hypothetical protein
MTPSEHRKWAAVFVPEPRSGWGFRGDPHVWRALGARLADADRPPRPEEAIEVVKAAFRDLVGVDLDEDPVVDAVYRPEFDGGGMSGGQVSPRAWREHLLPLLEQRLRDGSDD